MGERAKVILNEYSAKNLLMRDTLDLDKFYTADLKLFVEVARKEIERLNNIINELSKENKHLDGVNCKLRRKIGQLEDNQVRALNKIRDFINNANCELQESKYSNDNHGLYCELFKKNLTNIQKLIKGINTDKYVTIPKYREKELLNLEDNWDKLKEWLNNFHKSSEFEQWEIVNKMQKLEQGSD